MVVALSLALRTRRARRLAMALEMRPHCERCQKALPHGSAEARICSYECTFCARCVTEVLHHGVCPNCGGGLEARPVRRPKAVSAATN